MTTATATRITVDGEVFDTAMTYEEARAQTKPSVLEEGGIYCLLNPTDSRMTFDSVRAAEPVAQYEFIGPDGKWSRLSDYGRVINSSVDDRAYLEPGEMLPIMPVSTLASLAPPNEDRKRTARYILRQSFDHDIWGRPEFDTLIQRFGDRGAHKNATGEERDHAWTQRYWHLANGGGPPQGFFRNFNVRSGDGWSREEYNLLQWAIIKYLFFGERDEDWIWIMRIAISSLCYGVEHRKGIKHSMAWRYPKGNDNIGGALEPNVAKFWTEQWQLLYLLWPHPLLKNVLDAYYDECVFALPTSDGHNDGGMRVRHHTARELAARGRLRPGEPNVMLEGLAQRIEAARDATDKDWPNRLGITSGWMVLPANSFQAQLVRAGVLSSHRMTDIMECAERVLEKCLVREGGRLRALYRYKPAGHADVKVVHPATHLAFCLPGLRLLADAGIPKWQRLKAEAVDTIAEWITSSPGMYHGAEGPGHVKACAMVAHSVVGY